MTQKLLLVHYMKFSIKALRYTALVLIRIARKMNSVVLLTKSEKEILRRNRQFKNKHKGQRAFVIVNGPSLKEQNIDRLKNELTFVVSGFYKHEVVKQWQPTYYSIIDKNFFNGSEPTSAFFQQLNKTISGSTFFLPLYRGFVANRKFGLLPQEKTYYVATASAPGTRNNELDEVIQSFAGVSAFALAMAVYMGCTPIYLLGFDHDYLANRGVDRHFYTGGTVAGAEGNAKPLSELIPYDTEMLANWKLWRNYRALKAIASRQGIEIRNATIGGYLDVFERSNYEEIDFKTAGTGK